MKNRFLSMLIGAVLFVLSAAAENYPYRSDVLWVTVPDHADWLYKTGEKAKIEVQFYKCQYGKDHCINKYQFHPFPEFPMHSSRISQIIINLPAQRRCKLSIDKSLYAIKSRLSERKSIADTNISQKESYDHYH